MIDFRSPDASSGRKRVAVIGAGVTGLAAAHRLRELDPNVEVTVFEASDRPGGAIYTERRDGFLLEHGADMFTTKQPWALELCDRLGIKDQLIETNAAHRRAFIVHRGRLQPTPAGFAMMQPSKIWPLLTTPLLSLSGKARLFGEMFIALRTSDEDESLAAFARRRFGKQAYERIIQPLVGGIYTADPERLSMKAAMAPFVKAEKQDGGLLRSFWKQRKQAVKKPPEEGAGARYGMFLAPRQGMGVLIDALMEQLPENTVRLGTPVASISQESARDQPWRLRFSSSSHLEKEERFDGVIVAARSTAAAKLLRPVDEALARRLSEITYAGTSIVVLAYRREQIGHRLDGFGFVVPLVEKRRILAASFSSVKFAERAPPGCELIRVFVGGACQAELAELPESDLYDLVENELRELLNVRGAGLWRRVIRWPGAMPQYHVGHTARVEDIERHCRRLPQCELAGNAYHGVGVPFCIKSGIEAAERLTKALHL